MDAMVGPAWSLIGLLVLAVQLAILLYVLNLLRRTADGVEHIGVVLERALHRAFPSDRLTPDAAIEWVARPMEVEGVVVDPGDVGRVVDHTDELVVAFAGVTFTCAEGDVRPRS